jgi:hypothetical protein
VYSLFDILENKGFMLRFYPCKFEICKFGYGWITLENSARNNCLRAVQGANLLARYFITVSNESRSTIVHVGLSKVSIVNKE